MFWLTYVNGQMHANQRNLEVTGDYMNIKRRNTYNHKVIARQKELKKHSNALFYTWHKAFDLSIIQCLCFSIIRNCTETIFS